MDNSNQSPEPSVNKLAVQPNQSKRMLIIIAIAAALLAFGIGGYFLGMQKSSEMSQGQQSIYQPQASPTTATFSSPTPTNTVITPSTDSTTNWNTYTSGKFNFTIKYPKRISAYNENWQYEEFGNQVGFGTPSSKSGGYIWGVYVSEDKNIEELMKESGSQFSDRIESKQNIVVNGKSAILLTVTTNQVKDWVSKNVYIQDRGKVYAIMNGAVEHPEFDLFYNSFKFLN